MHFFALNIKLYFYERISSEIEFGNCTESRFPLKKLYIVLLQTKKIRETYFLKRMETNFLIEVRTRVFLKRIMRTCDQITRPLPTIYEQ